MIHFKKIIFSTLLLTTALQCMENQQDQERSESSYHMIGRSNLQQEGSSFQDSYQQRNPQNQQGLNQGSFLDGSVDLSILDAMDYNGRPNQQQRNDRRQQERNNQQQNQSNFTSTINNSQRFQEDNSLRLNENSIARDLVGNGYNRNLLQQNDNLEFYFGRNSNFEKMLKDFLYLPDSPRSDLVRKARDEHHFANYELPHQNLSDRKLKEKEEYFITTFGKPALVHMQKCQDPKEMEKRAHRLAREFYNLEKNYNELDKDYDQLDKDYNQLENRFFRLKDHFERIRSKKNHEINTLTQEKESLHNELQVKAADDAKQQEIQAQQQPVNGRVDRRFGK